MYIAALVEGHLFWSSVVGALARLGFGSSQPVPVGTACTHVARHLRVGIRCVEKYRFVSILRCRRIAEASPLDDDVHSEIPVGVERGSAFHLVVDCHPFEGAGERVYQGRLLVDLRSRSMAQSRTPRCPSHRSRGTSSPRTPPSPESGVLHELRCWDDPGRVDWTRPQEGGGT